MFNKAILTSTLAGIALLGTASAFAAGSAATADVSKDGVYISALGGLTYTPKINGTKYQQPGYRFTEALGYQFDNVRTEAELGYARSRVDLSGNSNLTGRTDVWTGMGNVYYDFNQVTWAVVPYVGAGMGYANITHLLKDNVGDAVSMGKDAFAYQGIVGGKYVVGDNVDVSADYRYLGTTDVKYTNIDGSTFSEGYRNHSLNIGLTYHFPQSAI